MATSLGTAWIQIKPSLSGVSNDIKKELAGATVYGTSSMSSAFNSTFQGLGKSLKNTFTEAFNSISSASKGIFTAGLSTAIGAITTQIGGAVSRIDTLNNAPRVFDAMGYAADAVANSMSDLNIYLDGLPTSLDSAVSNVQALAASFGGIENGTKYFKALNDAGLAFGASTEMIENGITQLSQLSLDGPLDAQTWNSLRNSGFGPVFAAMAQQAGITVGELKEQFGGNGTKTVQEFLDALIVMDEEGTDSMKSLSEMARANTDGIATSFKNAKTAITRGVGEVIKSIPNLSSSIAQAGKAVEGVLNGNMGIDEAAGKIQTALGGILGAVGSVLTKVVPMVLQILPGIIDSIVTGITELLANQEQVQQLIDGFVQLFFAVARGASQIAQAIIPLIPEIIGTFISELAKQENASAVIVGFGILLGVGTFKTIAGNLGGVLKNTIGKKFTSFFKTDIAKGVGEKAGSAVENIGTSLSKAIKGIAEPIKTAFVELGNILGSVVGAIMEPIKVLLKGIGEALSSFFTALADPMVAVGAAMFAVAAAAVAAAIFLIGTALGAVAEPIGHFFEEVLRPLGDWIRDTLIVLLESVTDSMVKLTQQAVIPLIDTVAGELTKVLEAIAGTIERVGAVVVNLAQNAFIPLINTLAGSLMGVLQTVGDIINNVVRGALEGIKGVIDSVGDGFLKMGQAVKTALEGVQGVLSVFAQMITAISSALVALVALATHQSVSYGYGFAQVTRAATGGLVGGIGTETSDSNLFALSKGEYVIRAAAARQIGYDNLDQMNETGSLGGTKVEAPIYINGYNKDPNELADIISRKIALRTRGVY